ncbi:MAG: 4-(cytidine 5'-diphospho)-2-C-methyl-D-erythritol kinase [Pseudomonadota bacterium]
MTTVEVFAPAKINLTLHVTGKREDGYHLLDSLVVFAKDIGDTVKVTDQPSLTLHVHGPMQAGVPTDESNVIVKAARLYQAKCAPNRGASIELTKRLPNGGGIGGGSADAGAVLRALCQLWRVELFSRPQAAAEIGADVAVCMTAPSPRRVVGVGENARLVNSLPRLWLVLANPGVHIPTADVFSRLSSNYRVDNEPMDNVPETQNFLEFEKWLRDQRNDLTPVVEDFCPEVRVCREALAALPGCRKADMSGSGSTCWGLFSNENDARAGVQLLEAAHPGWWVRSTEVEEFWNHSENYDLLFFNQLMRATT